MWGERLSRARKVFLSNALVLVSIRLLNRFNRDFDDTMSTSHPLAPPIALEKFHLYLH